MLTCGGADLLLVFVLVQAGESLIKETEQTVRRRRNSSRGRGADGLPASDRARPFSLFLLKVGVPRGRSPSRGRGLSSTGSVLRGGENEL